MHGVSGVPSKLASSPQPARLIASVFATPVHDDEFVSVTVIFPLVVPKFTVMLYVPFPDTILAPSGTVHA
jgi:hypothetical protein